MPDYATVLRDKGLRATSQRLVLLKQICEQTGHRHLTAAELYEKASESLPGLNLTTVYRTLEGLHDAGLVDRLSAGLDQVRYSYRDPDHRHGHLCCTACGRVGELDFQMVEQLARILKKQYDFQLAGDHLGLAGLCRDCQQRKSHP
jgi:Fur family transcriptional regulator, ferric uptake regulator